MTRVFCDGAAKGNPGPGGWGAIVATPEGHVTELGGADAYTTNNKMELTAAIAALRFAAHLPGRVEVFTDSTYVIKGIREWIWAWRRRGWKTAEGTDVLNRPLWEELSALVDARGSASIAWHWVRGHVGVPGNERVDEIADRHARRESVTLYNGPLTSYTVALDTVPSETSVPKRSTSAPQKSKAPAYSYVSVVDGVPMRHRTWGECERRVSGQSGAKFKKALSADDEVAILRAWRVDPSLLV